ncbi:MAG: hypothetical protein QXF45_07340 [Candidatus Caldarchaeum sp.]
MKRFLVSGLVLLLASLTPAWAIDGSGIGNSIAATIRGIIVTIIELSRPIPDEEWEELVEHVLNQLF